MNFYINFYKTEHLAELVSKKQKAETLLGDRQGRQQVINSDISAGQGWLYNLVWWTGLRS